MELKKTEKREAHGNENNKDNFRWFVGWSINDVPYSEVIDIDSSRV